MINPSKWLGLAGRLNRRNVSWTALIAVLAGLVVSVLSSEGFPAADLRLNDGGVWATYRNQNLFGRFNLPAQQLDALLYPGGNQPDIDVLQEASTVFLVDRTAGLLRPIDVSNRDYQHEDAALPAVARVALGGGVVAVLDEQTGKLWVRTAESAKALDVSQDAPTAEVGKAASIAVGLDGTVHAVSSDTNKLLSVTRSGEREQRDLPDVEGASVTAVGSVPVVLSKGGKLVLPDEVVSVDGSARLQQPGPESESVLLGTEKQLLQVDLSDGESASLSEVGKGGPAAPVRLGDCVHAAWAGSAPTYIRLCGPGKADQPVPLEGLSPNAELVFRVNRDAIVLNDAAEGNIYLFERGGADLGNWQELIERLKENPTKPPENSQPNRLVNNKPEAIDDTFGARPGQAALLHVLDNDTDPDGDVLTIVATTAVKPAGAGRLSVIANGQALQFVPSPGDYRQAVTFQYTISDGNGGTDPAGVTVNVKPDGNAPPYARPSNRVLELERGGTLTFNALRDWRDADGDALLLAQATVPLPDKVRFTPGGELTFTAAPNSSPGPKLVSLKVSDGTVLQDGSVTVNVVDRDRPPVAENDLVTAVAGQKVTIRPLDNDSDPNTTVPGSEQRLRLSFVGPSKAGSSATPDYVAGTITFKADLVDAYYLDYRVTDGKAEAAGRIRIDVRKPTSAYAPVAVADQVALRSGTPSVADVLANDVDLDGDVLVVRSVEVPENSGLSVSVIEHRWLRVSATRSDVGSPRYTVRYVVSDGERDDIGVLTVTRLESGDQNQPPVTVADIATVRAGDIVDIDVLANDSDPEGAALGLKPKVVDDNEASKRGLWLVSAGRVRFHALDKPGTSTASYTALDERGQSAVGQITVTVIASTAANQIPQPKPVQARAFAGGKVRIPIPLTGVDPDGDSVLLLGPMLAPQLGRIVDQGIDYFDYEAYPGAGGTDEFTYRVLDGFGGLGTGSVRIGVVAFPDRDTAPVAVDDEFVVAPGATVRVPVLTNDSDVDGDPLTVEDLKLLNPRLPEGTSLNGSVVVVKAGPNERDVVSVRYGISDGRGQRATATVRITSRAGANLPPIARDDIAGPVAAGATSVEVEVLLNDDDLDGPKSELTVEPINVGDAAPVTVSGSKLRIPLTKNARQVSYQLKDAHNGVAVAFVRVPGTGPQPPRLKDNPELVVTSGADLTVNVAELVVDPQGLPVRLIDTLSISTSPSGSLSLVPGTSTPTSFTLHAAAEFSGRAAVVFAVEDGQASASLSLRVKVVPSGKQPPVFSCPPVEPAAGAPPVTVELQRCVRSNAGEGLLFSLDSKAPAGLTVELAGSKLKISAAPDAEIGDRGKLKLTVTDEAKASAQGELAIVVRPSGLAVANTDYANAKVGEEVHVNVIGNDVNPFPNSPLKLVSLEAPGAPGARIDEGKGEVIFTPAKHGKVALQYTVQDATGKPDRRVNGSVEVTVIDKPLAPGQPIARSEGDKFAVLVWSEPDNQGSPVDRYTVTGNDGFSQTCAETVCRLDGLTNGKTYRFKVRAINAAGNGPESPESADVHPDAKPDQPQAPTTTFGDSKITLSWAAPNGNGGSSIQGYEVEISPGGISHPVNGTSYVWSGLDNGAAYTFRLRARNSNLFSEWSASSAPEIPARQPEAPQAPTAAGVADGIGQQIVVNWIEPVVNGAAVTEYQLTVIRAGVTERTITVPGDTTGATVNVDNGVDYRFTVVAVNKAGPSQASPASAATIAHGKPFPVLTHSYSDNSGGTGYDGRVSYSLSPPGDNGLAISSYEFDVDGNGSTDFGSGSASGYVTGLANGTDYQIRVRACNDMCGDWSGAGNVVRPYGPVRQPNAGAAKSGATSVTLSWSSAGENGRPLDRIEIRVNGGGWENVGTGAGSRGCGNGYDQTCSIDVRAFDIAGQVSPTASASARTDPPPGVVTVAKGASAQGQPGCSSPPCAYVVVTLSNFSPNTAYACDINSAHGDLFDVTVTTNGSGNGSRQALSYYGYPTGWVSATCNGITGTRNPWN
ncbi:fibronectin type III [Rhizocola hellebori]|uniref:Fibronectin type III n=1 Tax=Rhizocola hellebori TaxID=1392758 RepID=A0A8J3QHK8_9ACTN|nr:Ig-like domain-containing protein [Rhizocola hellebori]GIH09441.1 fibronectin type III [Rhizocola hellebori]